jgi:hypothetical protein
MRQNTIWLLISLLVAALMLLGYILFVSPQIGP